MKREVVKIGPCTLILGDAYEEIAKIKHASFSIVTDPPYEFSTAGGGKFRKSRPNMDDIENAGISRGFDLEVFNDLRLSSVITFCHQNQLSKLLVYLEARFHRVKLLSWHKTNPLPVFNKNYKPDTEFYIHAWNKGAEPIGGGDNLSQYIIHPNGKDKSLNHPTVKPLTVMDKIITNVNGDLIVDPFMGSGTTAISAMKQGLLFIGIEHNKIFFEEACKRIQTAYSDASLSEGEPK